MYFESLCGFNVYLVPTGWVRGVCGGLIHTCNKKTNCFVNYLVIII